MNKKILDKAIQDYILSHLSADVNQIALAKSPFEGVSAAELANQITAKKKAEKKLPSWVNAEGIYYPPALSIEQTSSEVTAKYKTKLVKGKSLIDITGGFGVDSFAFAKNIEQVIHCEINVELSDIAKHNAKVLGFDNIEFKALDGLDFTQNAKEKFGTIYIDPARRTQKGKVFMLKDCTPDVIGSLDVLLTKTQRIIIKTAPLLDISAGLQELSNVSEIHIVSLKNECKELLWVLEENFTTSPKIVAVTLNQEEKVFTFIKEEMNTETIYADLINPGDYLYEPDAALLKTGAFDLIGKHFKLLKLHPQTQLYISNSVDNEFPGRVFEIKEILSTGDLKREKSLRGNIIVRNYPGKPEELVRRYKIKSAKEDFIVFTKNIKGENIIILATIIQYY